MSKGGSRIRDMHLVPSVEWSPPHPLSTSTMDVFTDISCSPFDDCLGVALTIGLGLGCKWKLIYTIPAKSAHEIFNTNYDVGMYRHATKVKGA